MRLEIQDAIQDLVTPETLMVILDVVDTLLEKGYALALDELNQVLMLADDNCDSAMLVGRINDVLHYALTYALGEYGITMLPDAPLKEMHDVYKTLIYLPHYIIPSDIAHVFQGEYDTVETIAHLTPFFTMLTAEQIEPHIESVSIECIDTLQKLIDTKLATQTEALDERAPVERIKVINRLLATNDRAKFSMMLELADAGVRVGRSYDELIGLSFEGLEGKNPVEAAGQMVGLAFFSDLPLGGIWRQIDVSLDEYTDNPMERRFMLDEIATIKRNVGNLDETA